MHELANLKEIARCCQNGEAIDESLANWLANALQGFFDRDCQTFEEAFGLKFPKGGIPWWREEANRIRDDALRELANTCFGNLSSCAKAREIFKMTSRYAATAWRFDSEKNCMPLHYKGKSQEYLWIAFKSRAPMPIGERQLRNILAS